MKRDISLIAVCGVLLMMVSCTRTEKTYYPDGSVQSVITYKGGKENGKTVYLYNHPNTVEIEVEMKNGKRNGQFFRYYENGYLDTKCTYVNDSIEGLQVMYTANGEKSQEYTYVRGIKNGPHKAYHLNGEVKIEGGFKEDMFDGPWYYYDERGVLVGEGTFKKGTGSVTFYGPTGHVIRTTHYVNNKKDGSEVEYDENGNELSVTVFKADRIVSKTEAPSK